MVLNSDLISQFVKTTNDKTDAKRETIVYGTVYSVDAQGNVAVHLDGAEADIITPVDSTISVANGDRVIVMLKNHTATITGSTNVEGRAARVETVTELTADKATIRSLDAAIARIIDMEANRATIDLLNVTDATVIKLLARNAVAESLKAAYADINLLNVADANVVKLLARKAVVDSLSSKYADVDFSNIGEAAIEELFAGHGIIKDFVMQDGAVTGELNAVTVNGDLINTSTLKADRIILKGEDGLYRQLNVDSGVVSGDEVSESELQNGLHGDVLIKKSIAADKVDVSDLHAFGATLGGFRLTEDSIYSDVKDSEGNTTRGIYMDSDGQINFGDASNFIKYYRDEDGIYKLAISAASILYALNGKQYSIADIGHIGEYVHVGTYEGEPCIELGENDSDFKLVITNTRIIFKEGSETPAYINNQSLHITKAVIEEEIQQGEFVWKARQNGNMGLMWKGEA